MFGNSKIVWIFKKFPVLKMFGISKNVSNFQIMFLFDKKCEHFKKLSLLSLWEKFKMEYFLTSWTIFKKYENFLKNPSSSWKSRSFFLKPEQFFKCEHSWIYVPEKPEQFLKNMKIFWKYEHSLIFMKNFWNHKLFWNFEHFLKKREQFWKLPKKSKTHNVLKKNKKL